MREKKGRNPRWEKKLRDDRPCDLLFQCSDLTWCAYNRWPDKWSLYDDGKV
ncbi:MAG: hypothetical protein IH987_13715, partial [Planctomycetes bacterium]|nr:hypothetical protein [Planctomycetota bacterium]